MTEYSQIVLYLQKNKQDLPEQDVEKISDDPDSDIDDEYDQIKTPPKKFLAHSLAESLFNGLLLTIRHKGIPKQKGFLHLRRVTGYGSTASANKHPNIVALPKLPLRNFVRSTIKLTRQTIQEACEKERQKKLKAYHQGGIPRYRPFMDFLDEFKHLVREAERHDQVDVSTKRMHLQSGWANVMEEIRSKGVLKSINEQVETERMDTVYGLWFKLHNKADRNENAAMASVHEARCVVQEELKNAVKKMRNKAQSEDETLTNYYADLKDQMVDALHLNMLALNSDKQINSELKNRKEQDDELKDDPIRKKVTTGWGAVHEELKNIYARVKKEDKKKKNEMISKQEKLKETIMGDVVNAYLKKMTFAEMARNQLGKIKEQRASKKPKHPPQGLVEDVVTQIHKGDVKKVKREKATKI